MKTKRKTQIRIEDDVMAHIADEDGDISSDGDLCASCECARVLHEDGSGECSCGECRRFKG
jgi:hypothetical protein